MILNKESRMSYKYVLKLKDYITRRGTIFVANYSCLSVICLYKKYIYTLWNAYEITAYMSMWPECLNMFMSNVIYTYITLFVDLTNMFFKLRIF